jgi:hypothetical protein
MKILLDHNTPLGVRRILANHDVYPAGQMGWATLSNSNLLDAAERVCSYDIRGIRSAAQ